MPRQVAHSLYSPYSLTHFTHLIKMSKYPTKKLQELGYTPAEAKTIQDTNKRQREDDQSAGTSNKRTSYANVT